MKIYIAGKIAGDRRYRTKFREAAKKLEAMGHAILNPATLPDGLEQADYMRICLAMVEWAYCQRIGKDCAMYMDVAGGGGLPGSAYHLCKYARLGNHTTP